MLKKIKLLGTLLIVALILGGVSWCSDPRYRQSYREGFEKGYETATAQGRFQGHPADGTAKEKSRRPNATTLRLIPNDYRHFTETILNTKSGMVVPLSMQSVKVDLGVIAVPFEWLGIILVVLYILSFLCFIVLLIRFIASLKSGEIFNRGNEWKLRWMGILFIVIFLADLGIEGIEFATAKSAIALENYKVAMNQVSFFPLITGIVFLLFAQIFAMGRNMKEDQEFMV